MLLISGKILFSPKGLGITNSSVLGLGKLTPPIVLVLSAQTFWLVKARLQIQKQKMIQKKFFFIAKY